VLLNKHSVDVWSYLLSHDARQFHAVTWRFPVRDKANRVFPRLAFTILQLQTVCCSISYGTYSGVHGRRRRATVSRVIARSVTWSELNQSASAFDLCTNWFLLLNVLTAAKMSRWCLSCDAVWDCKCTNLSVEYLLPSSGLKFLTSLNWSQVLKVEASCSSRKLDSICKTTWRSNPEDRHRRFRRLLHVSEDLLCLKKR
jgi:hypothetical protein